MNQLALRFKKAWLTVFALGCVGFLAQTQAADPVAPNTALAGGNTADGHLALQDLTTGTYNSAFGIYSLLSNGAASFNTGFGAGTLLTNTANENTATGAGALLSNTTAANNTANGTFALISNTTGASNTAFGDRALFNNTTGGNIALGANAGINLTASGIISISVIAVWPATLVASELVIRRFTQGYL
jgi:hypothetical protein